MFTTPIAYIVFNRPWHTRKSFAALRLLRPEHLFIVADGPRIGHATDEVRCREVRRIVSEIDWPCRVSHNYSEQNLGCKERVTSGLNWLFSQVEEAIVLEDDCLPHPDFFVFCEVLLERYKYDHRVMVITGNNFQAGRTCGDSSYYFSKYNHVWGWASWRRAWQINDPTLAFWPEWKKSVEWIKHTPDKVERYHWENIFDQMYRNEIDTWDYPWMANVWYSGGLSATPHVNLVSNIGIGPEGTHTVAAEDQEGLPVFSLGPMNHPSNVIQDKKADRYEFDYIYGGRELRLYRRIKTLPRKIVNKIIRTVMGR